ncbi:TrbI/VirB10 family protein, partial [Erythrobacter sp. GH1-10]|uniref:TrbI/VirB10 family protein n=1 Tax=Erythrobacter sp. GH1-10 TaxID=3349334 RepID=UPI003877CCE5
PIAQPIALPPTPAPPIALPIPIRPTPVPAQPQVVFESRIPQDTQPSLAEGGTGRERVQAGRFLNPSRTIPQGTVIPAVLETALDSTRAGGVRALVQRDVSSFDGTRVLIPRGSRLYGEYEANLQRGQNRALVQWTRVIRPDGVTVALDSPSSDPLGRTGIKGKVDGKFWQRFGGALLNSVLDIGVGVAVNEASDGVIVALPGSTQNIDVVDTEQIRPTLKVKQGTSVSVFVARDLDFSSVER